MGLPELDQWADAMWDAVAGQISKAEWRVAAKEVLQCCLEEDRKRNMIGGDEPEEGDVLEEDAFEVLMERALEPELSVQDRASRLTTAWREWFGTGGPGVFNRLAMAADVERVIEAAVVQALDEMTEAPTEES